MRLQRLLRRSVRTWRRVAGSDSRFERVARAQYRRLVVDRTHRKSTRSFAQYSGRNFVVVRSRKEDEPRRGILLRGGCDLPSAFSAAPLIASGVSGSVAFFKQGTGGELGAHRTDQMLQTLNGVSEVDTAEVRRRLRLEPHYFSPRLFEEKDFEIDAHPEFGRFPKTVVILSVGSDLVRVVYRHRVHGYLVDPGGFWLNNLTDKVLPDPKVARWFKENFESIGRISVDDFHRNLRDVVLLLRERVGAHVVVYNTLVVEPGDQTHNYQLLEGAHVVRRREFNLALTDLSSTLGFHVVDVDRILKSNGVREQVDFAHIPFSEMAPIGAEVHAILRELEVV